jgi:hypothetical protein
MLVATSARAQISSPPTLQGQSAVHAWSVPLVINDGAMGVAITCTNTLASTVIVGVEIFGPGGTALNDASATSVSVAPGQKVMFVTGTMALFQADGNLLPGLLSKGSAPILTTASSKVSQQVLCSAILADRFNDPPAAMTSLPVIRKNTQQGD